MTWRIVNVHLTDVAPREEKTARLATVLLAGDDEKSTPRSLKYGVSFVHDEAPCCRIQGKLGHAMRRKRLSAVELVNIYLDRIETKDIGLGSFVEVNTTAALAQAKKVDEALAIGAPLHPLAGIPLAVKDNICYNGAPTTTAGSQLLGQHASSYDADVISALKECDCVFLGKTNMDEFGMGSTTETAAAGPTSNPWNLSHVPGGSSGGSAAAVASQLCTAALGSDTGGSIRQPAAFCGVVGLKPTYGAVSRHGLLAYSSSFDTVGPIAQTVADVSCIFDAIRADRNGRVQRDASLRGSGGFKPTFQQASDLVLKPLKGKRFAVIVEAIEEGISAEVRNSFFESIKQIEELGGTVDVVSCATFRLGLPAYYIIASSEASSNLARYDGIQMGSTSDDAGDSCNSRRRFMLGEEVRRRILMGTYVLSSGYSDEYYTRAKCAQNGVHNELMGYLQDYDALLTPATPDVAYKMGDKISNPLQMYVGDLLTVNVNLAGLPAVVVRSGLSHVEGGVLPVGLQFIGKHFGEAQLLEMAHAFEATKNISLPEVDVFSWL